MRFTTPKDNLAKALSIANHSISNRSSLPITQNVLLKADHQGVTLESTNLQTHISTTLQASVETPGETTVPARLISEFVASLPSEPITLEVQPGTNVAHLTCGKAQAHIHGAAAEDFPPTPTIEPDASAFLKPEALRKAINRTVFSAAQDESRPILTGIYLKFSADTFVMAAADGFRLSVTEHSMDTPVDTDTVAIVPARALQTLARLLPDSDEPVEIRLSTHKAQVLFALPGTTLIASLLAGAFPDYQQLIPKSADTKSTFNTKDLVRAAKTASIFADHGSNIIRIMLDPGDTPEQPGFATIAAQTDDVGDNRERLPLHSFEGPSTKIALNSRYIRDALAPIDPDPIILEVTSSTTPAVFRPVDPEDRYVQVVMPMFVQW